jgi:hypothetical protein
MVLQAMACMPVKVRGLGLRIIIIVGLVLALEGTNTNAAVGIIVVEYNNQTANRTNL